MNFSTKKADGSGRLQSGWYAYDESPDWSAESDRYIGPFRTEREAQAAIDKAEKEATEDKPAYDIICELAVEAGKTTAMKAASESHQRVRNYME